MSELCYILIGMLGIFYETVETLERMQPFHETDAGRVSELTRTLVDSMHRHTLLPMGMGVGNQGLSAKFLALSHAMILETNSLPSFQSLLQACSSLTTDCGVEYGLANMPPLDVEQAFPWWSRQHNCDLVGDDDDAELPDASHFQRYLVNFSSALTVPGMEHLCHGAYKFACESMKSGTVELVP